jgi:hypothetical protein
MSLSKAARFCLCYPLLFLSFLLPPTLVCSSVSSVIAISNFIFAAELSAYPKMEGPMVYTPSSGPSVATSPKHALLPKTSTDSVSEITSQTTRIPRSRLSNFFWFSRSERPKKRELPTIIKQSTKGPDTRPTFKPTLYRSNPDMQPRIEASPYLWPHDSTFDQKTTALVIIDMQKDCGCQHNFMTPRVVLFLWPTSHV